MWYNWLPDSVAQASWRASWLYATFCTWKSLGGNPVASPGPPFWRISAAGFQLVKESTNSIRTTSSSPSKVLDHIKPLMCTPFLGIFVVWLQCVFKAVCGAFDLNLPFFERGDPFSTLKKEDRSPIRYVQSPHSRSSTLSLHKKVGQVGHYSSGFLFIRPMICEVQVQICFQSGSLTWILYPKNLT